MAVTAIVLGVLSPAAFADDLNLLVNGKAIHLGHKEGVTFNERNWGAGVEYDFGRATDPWIPFLNASGFNDSNHNPSYYAGGGLMRRFALAPDLDNLHLDVGAVAFVMTRKNYKNGAWFPGALPAVSFGTNRVAVNVTYVPAVDPKMVPLWFFQLKVRVAEF